MWDTIKTYAAGFGLLLIAALFGRNKYLSKKNKKLEVKNETNEKLKDIREEQEADKVEVLADEKIRIKKRITDSKSDSRRDRAKRL